MDMGLRDLDGGLGDHQKVGMGGWGVGGPVPISTTPSVTPSPRPAGAHS